MAISLYFLSPSLTHHLAHIANLRDLTFWENVQPEDLHKVRGLHNCLLFR